LPDAVVPYDVGAELALVYALIPCVIEPIPELTEFDSEPA
jgi:hypothetical protein